MVDDASACGHLRMKVGDHEVYVWPFCVSSVGLDRELSHLVSNRFEPCSLFFQVAGSPELRCKSYRRSKLGIEKRRNCGFDNGYLVALRPLL